VGSWLGCVEGFSARDFLRQFDDGLPAFEGGDEERQRERESLQQDRRTDVSYTDPNYSGTVQTEYSSPREIFVLGHNNGVDTQSFAPNAVIGCSR
jgi:hypothetical protein